MNFQIADLAYADNGPISVYIHWPYCLSKCPYCDFNSHVTDNINHGMWLECYRNEFSRFSQIIKGRQIKSIFFGGGTPSLMKPFVVEGIITEISDIANIDQNTEITLEANPTSFEAAKFQEFRIAGINRVSIGVQSLRSEGLKFLGRTHDPQQAISAITAANKIFDRVSFDLMYGLENQQLQGWLCELQEAMQIANGHISLYQLTIEKGTPFYKLFQEGKLVLPQEDIALEMYNATTDYLNMLGYNRYEISNYAKIGNESIHNLAYWNYQDYLGIGPGAHSRIKLNSNVHAMAMIYNPTKWLNSIDSGTHAIQSFEKLSESTAATEALMMGTRLASGINVSSIKQYLDYDVIQKYQDIELLSYENETLQLKPKGLMLHSYIVPRLLNKM